MAKSTEEERIANVHFDLAVVNSDFIRPMRMNFRRRGRDLYWDMALEHDNVAALIFHTERKQLLFVKQFRPPVFVNVVRSLPENKNKSLAEVRWENYPIENGCTVELCAGLMDEPGKTPLEHMKKEILEECGYRVDESNIRPIRRYVTGISLSGAIQHLFYVELDESMWEPKAGGGNEHEGEFIQNVFMDIGEAEELLEKENLGSPPSFLFAISWWVLNEKERLLRNAK
ncbi:hypothetical protein niasHS_010987 [Heterodera schachtii]|uniref:Uridine diphosphate glucose pyrophosphatase NUDT14 n=1 Tax=Heterodera schachtii TaxID=97005 RepID=A0ABD2IZU9_HETSC